MNKKTMAGIANWVLACALVLVGFLWFIRPVMGLIGLVALVLFYNLAITLSPSLHEALRENRKAMKDRLSGLFRRKQGSRPITDPSTFVPTHYLVCAGMDPPIRKLVDKESFVVGRDAGCDLRITHEGSVSGQHCRITYGAHSRQYYIEDLRSTMGTFLGTKRLEANAPEKLYDESEISVSNLRFVFTRSTAGPQPAPGGVNPIYRAPIPTGQHTNPNAAGMMLTLQVTHNGAAQTKTAIVGPGYTIGRSPQCHLVLSQDPAAGRRHAQLLVRDGQLFVKDLYAQNGTFVGETRLAPGQERQLSSGETLRVGRHHIQVTY